MTPFSLVAAYSPLAISIWSKAISRKPLRCSSVACISVGRLISTYAFLASAQLGYAYVHLSRSAEALPLLEEAAKRPSLGVGIGFHFRWLSEAYLHAGRRDDAIAVGRRTLDRARKSMERGQEAWALRLLGEIARKALSRRSTRPRSIIGAMTLAEELGMRPLVAHCHVGLGKLYRRAGIGRTVTSISPSRQQ